MPRSRSSRRSDGGSPPASKAPSSAGHFVYVVRCADGTLYTGCARDVTRRVALHNAGRGAKYTAGRRPVSLVYSESFRSLGAALSREYALKRLTRAAKEALLEPAARSRARA